MLSKLDSWAAWRLCPLLSFALSSDCPISSVSEVPTAAEPEQCRVWAASLPRRRGPRILVTVNILFETQGLELKAEDHHLPVRAWFNACQTVFLLHERITSDRQYDTARSAKELGV